MTIFSENNPSICEIIGRILGFINNHPEDGIQHLEEFLDRGDKLLSTDDVMSITGWSRTYIIKLCRSGHLPHIPGNPHKFMRGPLNNALLKLMVGGDYGKRKIKPKKPMATAKKAA